MLTWGRAHPGYAAACVKLRREREGEVMRAYERALYRAQPLQHKARIAVNQAVRRGNLFRQPCEVCGAVEVDGHHDDYTKPLDVRWLCRKHHVELHLAARDHLVASVEADS